jgi:4a-hydroxytetrahydrobiopterin dehydratase
MAVLSDPEIASRLSSISGWKVEKGELTRTFTFKDFHHAMTFVDSIGKLAEKENHHPDIDIRYNRVRLALVSHDAGGLTAKDFEMALAADQLV